MSNPNNDPDENESNIDKTEETTHTRDEFQSDPIQHAQVNAGMTVGELASEYEHAGIGAASMDTAVDIYAKMLARDDIDIFFGLAGAMVPAGMRQIIVDLIRDGHIDALVTTGANLTHDAIEAIGGKHHHGKPTHQMLARMMGLMMLLSRHTLKPMEHVHMMSDCVRRVLTEFIMYISHKNILRS